METTLDTASIAAEALDAIDHRKRLQPFSERIDGLDLAAAYRVTAQIYGTRIARGERRLGRKIGFTNRTIWDEYKVFGPIWGYMYDTTLFRLAQAGDLGVPAHRVAFDHRHGNARHRLGLALGLRELGHEGCFRCFSRHARHPFVNAKKAGSPRPSHFCLNGPRQYIRGH